MHQSVNQILWCMFWWTCSVRQQFSRLMGRVEWVFQGVVGLLQVPGGEDVAQVAIALWYSVRFLWFFAGTFLSAAELLWYHTRMLCVRTLGKSASTLTPGAAATVTFFSMFSGSTVIFVSPGPAPWWLLQFTMWGLLAEKYQGLFITFYVKLNVPSN